MQQALSATPAQPPARTPQLVPAATHPTFATCLLHHGHSLTVPLLDTAAGRRLASSLLSLSSLCGAVRLPVVRRYRLSAVPSCWANAWVLFRPASATLSRVGQARNPKAAGRYSDSNSDYGAAVSAKMARVRSGWVAEAPTNPATDHAMIRLVTRLFVRCQSLLDDLCHLGRHVTARRHPSKRLEAGSQGWAT